MGHRNTTWRHNIPLLPAFIQHEIRSSSATKIPALVQNLPCDLAHRWRVDFVRFRSSSILLCDWRIPVWQFSHTVIWYVMSDVSGILLQIESDDPSAAEQLLPLVYDELRKLAAAKL